MQLPKMFQNPIHSIHELRNRPEAFWMKRGERMALELFREMSKRVPAYKDFLKKNKIHTKSIKTIKDFSKLPTLDKDNYIRKYSLPEMCWDGKFAEGQYIVSTTSGSTGEPVYFPRNHTQNIQYANFAELYLLTNFKINQQKTLYVNAFPMGAWIGGVFTYDAIRIIAESRKYHLTIISPGLHKKEVIKAIVKLGPYFDQVIIGSYGPFLKDIIDDGIESGVKWYKYNLKFIFSAEGFTETFRDYMIKKGGLKNPYLDTLNHYGVVDLGTLSYETPVSILIRRLLLNNKKAYKNMFGDINKLPTLTQYIPELFYFEDTDKNLICSGYSGLPLVRYDLKDHGGIISYNDSVKILKKENIDLNQEIKKTDIKDTLWELPFVHVYERDDFSVSLYAFQIYPETIRKSLQKNKFEKLLTGKFTMVVAYTKQQNQELQVNVEMKHKVRSSEKLKKNIQDSILKQLLVENSEYRETYGHKGDRISPRIIFWKYEDPKYFRSGIKQKWVK